MTPISKQAIDPGFGRSFSGKNKRIINPDGSFNVVRNGTRFNTADTYQYLITISWKRFIGFIIAFLVILNVLFALVYQAIGIETISGTQPGSFFDEFAQMFFFSVQTFTTVGYGAMSPVGSMTSLVASFEAMGGLIGFALASGLLYGRFSRPTARIKYSKKAIIAPYNDTNALMFKIVNMRSNVMMECEARMMLVLAEKSNGKMQRNYYNLRLETHKIQFFPLTWTLVHPIDKNSPLYGMTKEELTEKGAEILSLVKGFDDKFSQVVHSRHSYLVENMVVGAKYVPSFSTNEEGDTVLNLNSISKCERANLNATDGPFGKQVLEK